MRRACCRWHCIWAVGGCGFDRRSWHGRIALTDWRAVLRLAAKADTCNFSYACNLMMASASTSPGRNINNDAFVAQVSTQTQCAMRGSWTAGWGRFSLALPLASHRLNEIHLQAIECRVHIQRETGGWRWGGLVHGTCSTRRPHGRLGRASCTAYTASAGAEGRSVVLSSPLHCRPMFPVPMPSCPTKPCEAALLLLPVLSTSPPSASPPAQHSAAPHYTARRCAFAAPSPPMMLPLLPLLPPPMLPVPVSPRALAPRGLGLSTRPSRYRRNNRVFYSRNPHCDCGLGQRSEHASPIPLDKGRSL